MRSSHAKLVFSMNLVYFPQGEYTIYDNTSLVSQTDARDYDCVHSYSFRLYSSDLQQNLTPTN